MALASNKSRCEFSWVTQTGRGHLCSHTNGYLDTTGVTHAGPTPLGSRTLNTHYHRLGCGHCWCHTLGGWALLGLHTGMGTLLVSHTGVCTFMMSHRTGWNDARAVRLVTLIKRAKLKHHLLKVGGRWSKVALRPW